jgi:5-methylcytosine-specific restriction endonuclease McrA
MKCRRVREAIRNASPGRNGYRSRFYRAQPKDGICWICGLPGADTRDHIVPLSKDSSSLATRPAHRSCNSSRGARRA